MKIIIYILIAITILSTIGICIKRPEMHKTVLVYDSGYTLVQDNDVEVESTSIPVMVQSQEPTTEQVTVTQKIDQQIADQFEQMMARENVTETPVTTTVTSHKTVQQPKTVAQQQTSTVKYEPVTVQKHNSNVYQPDYWTEPVNKTVSSAPTQTTRQTKQPEQYQTKTINAPVGKTNSSNVNYPISRQNNTVSAPQPTLTPQQEEIAWNRWRSRLTNQIMKDSKLPIVADGTIFKFSFTVDKYGKVTNVKTWSTNPQYTPYAIQYIAPVIRSYQGHSILNFPAGSQRVITDVTGTWKVTSGAGSYSTPQNYSDVEKVIR